MKLAYTYIISNKSRNTLYIGVTNDLERRMFEYKCEKESVFCSKYKLTDLLYYEDYGYMIDAINREKQLKRWHRKWKWNLIKAHNPELKDLSTEWFDEETIQNINACKYVKTIHGH